MRRRTFSKLLGAAAVPPPAMWGGAQSSKRIKVGVITHEEGAHLSGYLSSLAQADEVESVALSDPSGQSIKAARETLGGKFVEAYDDPVSMLREEKPVMALVTMEAALSPPAIDAALEAGCHVMAEKPACVRAEDFEALNKKAKSKNLHLMLALANRLNPEIREARRLIREGKIGDMYGLEMHLVADQTRLKSPEYHRTWRARKSRGGGGHLIWLGIHWLDLAMFVTGARIEEVAGFAGVVGGQPLDVEDSAAVAMRFDNGSFGTMTSGYYLDRGYHSHIKIWGSAGWLHIHRHGGTPLEWYSNKEENPRVRQFEGSQEPSGYAPFVRAAVRASAGLEDPPVTGDESLYVLKTVFACYEAAETGETQRVA